MSVGPAKTENSLRPATIEDIPKILEIEQKIHAAPWTEHNLISELEKPYSHFLVITDDETDSIISGYIVFWLMFDECQILNVAVDLPFRGLGLAKHMVRTAIGFASRKNITKVHLEVRKGNLPAIQLYQGIGFSITQVRKAFYSNGEDAYQMHLDLSAPRLDF